MFTRRELAFGAFGALFAASDLDAREVPIAGEWGPTFVLCTPRHGPSPGALVVLLHGLAETVDARLGRNAWLDLYGLATAYTRLRRAPIAQVSARDDWGQDRLAALNAELAVRPFRGFAVACPFTPNVWRTLSASAALNRYAAWLGETLLPRARQEVRLSPDAMAAIGGCSLGGFIGLEAFLRRREFATFAGVQSALGERGAAAYADRVATRGAAHPLVLVTSRGDPYLRANEALAGELARRGIPRTLVVRPGPHDQPWLREAGSIELLAALDASLTQHGGALGPRPGG